jgi:hypothetical protein
MEGELEDTRRGLPERAMSSRYILASFEIRSGNLQESAPAIASDSVSQQGTGDSTS